MKRRQKDNNISRLREERRDKKRIRFREKRDDVVVRLHFVFSRKTQNISSEQEETAKITERSKKKAANRETPRGKEIDMKKGLKRWHRS